MGEEHGLLEPLVLGIIEGLTEFLPISSTAHILLTDYVFGFDQPSTFFVLVQLGAILAIVTIYFAKLWSLLVDGLRGNKAALSFALNVVLATFPAAMAGLLLHDFIQQTLYENPVQICALLLIGGIILLFVDRIPLKPKYTDIYSYPWHLSLIVGLFQMLALVPGVSRSGATIVGALLFGTDKRSAAEFTFFIALPIMAGAFAYDLYNDRALIFSGTIGLDILIGFVSAFVVAVFVVRYLLDFVSNHGFAPFAWWRIFVGATGLVALYFTGAF